MAGFNAVNKIYTDPTYQNSALEGILEPVLALTGTWDPAYGHVTRGHMTKRVTGVTVQGQVNTTVQRPLIVGKVTAVAGNTVTLAAGCAIGTGTVGKTLTKVTAAGVVSALAGTVAAVKDAEGSTESRTIYTVDVTFSAAPGVAVGDFIGCEGLTATDTVDGITYESHNKDQDPTCSVVVRGALETAKLSGNATILAKFIPNARDRDGVFLFQTF